MPTMSQLPEAAVTNTTDLLAIDQSGTTRSVTLDVLTSTLQPKLTLAQGALLGRVSVTPGQPEPVAIGTGITLNSGTISTDSTVVAGLHSPSFTGSPTAPTPPSTDSSNRLATTAFVESRYFSPIVVSGDVSGAGLSSIDLTLPAITTPGTFTKVAVNAKGQVTGGSSLTGTDVIGLDVSRATTLAAGATSSATQAARAALQLDAVTDFGADPTGSTDSTTAIQAGLNALATAGGGMLRLVGVFKISSTLTIRASHVGLLGLGRGQLHGDLSWSATSRLVWAGASGGMMLDVSPLVNTTSGKALIGCKVDDVLFDCASLASVGVRIASVRHGRFRIAYLNPLSGTSLQAAVVFDTIDIAEYNDTQHNTINITGAELGPAGLGVLLQAKSRGCRVNGQHYYGNVSYNIFEDLQLHYWRGVPLTLRESDNNIFRIWGLNAPPMVPPAYATPAVANCASVEIQGSSDTTWAFPAINNVFEHGGCAGPINCRGTPSFTQASGTSSGQPAPNLFLRLDKANGVPDPTIETGATAYFGDISFIENGRAITQPTFSDSRASVQALRATQSPGGAILHAGSGPAARIVSPAMAHSWTVATQDDGSLAINPATSSERFIYLGSNSSNLVIANAGFWAGDPSQSQLVFTGATNGVPPTMRAASSTISNVSLFLSAQGTGYFYMGNSNGIQFQVVDSGGASANFLSTHGAVTGGAPVLYAVGSDANIDLLMQPKGTGLVRVTTPAASDNSTAVASTAWVREQSYLTSLPIASTGTVGGVMAGSNVSISTTGVLSIPSLNASPIGATTPSTGSFTTLSTSGTATLSGGVVITGGPAINSFNSSWTSGNPGNGAFQWNITGSVPSGGVIGTLTNIYNNGPYCAQAQKMNYWTYAGNADSVDNAQTLIGIYNPTNPLSSNMGAELVRWTVGITPNDTTHNWTHVVEEYNVVNRGLDMGWKAYRNDPVNHITGTQQVTGIHNYSPEATGLGQPGAGANLLFAELFGQSAANNANTGLPSRFYNASMYEPNCVVGLAGRAIYINGDITGTSSNYPFAPIEFDHTWLHGLRTTQATFTDGAAISMASGQKLTWEVPAVSAPGAGATGGNVAGPSGATPQSVASISASGTGANQDIILTPAGTGSVRLTSITSTIGSTSGVNLGTSNGTVLQVADSGVSAASRLVLTPGNGGAPVIAAVSGETNQGLNFRSAGTGQINFQSSAGGNSLTVIPNSTAVNALSVTGGSTGQNVVLGVNGSDTNVTIQIVPQGTGTVYMNKAQIAGGTIDGTPIGATTASSANFTTLSASGTVTTSGLTALSSAGLSLATSQGTIVQAKDNGTTAATKLVVTPGNGATPALIALSGETNQGLTFRSAGTGQINFQSSAGGNTNSLTILPNSTAVNALSVTGGSTGQNVVLGVNGSDSNVTIQIVPQGTGTVYMSKAQITGGTIDGTPIGSSITSSGKFTSLSTSGAASFAAGIADASTNTQTPTTGFSITVPNGVSTLQLTPAGTLATGAITMPSAPVAGQWLMVCSTAAITSCSFLANTGQTIQGAPSTLQAFSEVMFQYQSGSAKWICQSGNDTRLVTALSSTTLSPYAQAALFGTGVDGSVTISSGTTSLSRDMHYSNLTINGTGALKTNGWRVFVSGTLDLSAAPAGAIQANGATGANGSGSSGGSATGLTAPSFTVPAGGSGAAGGAGSTGTGSAGGASVGGAALAGGAGGASGSGGVGSNPGGSGTSSPTATLISSLVFAGPPHLLGISSGTPYYTFAAFTPGGGGGGGGDSTNAGGGGGSAGGGAGAVVIAARFLNRGASTAIGAIQAKGGTAGTGANGTGGADYDEAARVKRNEAARDSGMMPPTVTR